MKKILVALAFLALLPGAASAATLTWGENTVITQETKDNLYIAGGNAAVNAPIQGDLLAAGGVVTVSNSVRDDIAVGGGTVIINADIGGDARIAGGTLAINSRQVGGDLLVAGGNITLPPTLTVGKDAVLAGGNVNMNGTYKGSARVYGGNITLAGSYQGDVKVVTQDKLAFGDNLSITGNLTYSAPKELTVPAGAVRGTVTYEAPKKQVSTGAVAGAAFGILFIWKLLAALIAALILLWVFPLSTRESASLGASHAGPELVRGLVLFIVLPVVAVLALVTIFGAMVAGATFISFLLILVLSCAVSGIVFGVWFERYILRRAEVYISWKTVLIGTVLLHFIGTVPFVGWVVTFGTMLVALGAVAQTLYQKVRGETV